MKSKLFTICLSFISLFQVYAQFPSDCINAVEICTKETLTVLQESANGTVLESLGEVCAFSQFPVDTESSAYWIRYEFISDGDFIFRITSGIEAADLDFIVFQSDSNDCSNLNSVRCMRTGENVGAYTDPACLGPTGLAFGSMDTNEDIGCRDGDDNFLAPLQVKSGEVYFLLINNFNFDGMDNFTIEHGGSAFLSCETSSTTSTNSRLANNIMVSPNPFTDMINIKTLDTFSADTQMQITDLHGRTVFTKTNLREGNMDLSGLISGIYFLQITNNAGEIGLHKIVKQ